MLNMVFKLDLPRLWQPARQPRLPTGLATRAGNSAATPDAIRASPGRNPASPGRNPTSTFRKPRPALAATPVWQLASKACRQLAT